MKLSLLLLILDFIPTPTLKPLMSNYIPFVKVLSINTIVSSLMNEQQFDILHLLLLQKVFMN